MQRLLLFAYAIYAVNLFIVGPARTRVFIGLTLGLWVVVACVVAWSHAYPEVPASRVLFAPRGPRTDVPFMTRLELLRSGLVFLVWGGLIFSVYVGLVIKLGSHLFDSLVLACSAGTFMLGGLLALVAGGYLLLRGLFRSSAYRPPTPTASETPDAA